VSGDIDVHFRATGGSHRDAAFYFFASFFNLLLMAISIKIVQDEYAGASDRKNRDFSEKLSSSGKRTGNGRKFSKITRKIREFSFNYIIEKVKLRNSFVLY